MFSRRRLLEQSSIKLGGVLSDVFGASGAAMLEALILKGESDPQRIAALAKGRLQNKQAEIVRALERYRLPETHRFLIRQTMEHLAAMLQQIDELDAHLRQVLDSRPEFAEAAQLVASIPRHASGERRRNGGGSGVRCESFSECRALEFLGWRMPG